MESPVLLSLLATDLMIGFGLGWWLGRSRSHGPVVAAVLPGETIQAMESDLSRHAGDLRGFSLEVNSARDAGAIISPERLGRICELSEVTQFRIATGANRLSAMAAGKAAPWRRLVLRVSQHCGILEEFCITARETLDSPSLTSVSDEMTGALDKVLASNRHLENELRQARQMIAEQESRLREAERDARVDSLTKLANRRALDERLEGCQSRFEREQEGYAIVLFDLDAFKPLNDTYGHEAGDAVLAVFGRILAESVRSYDHAARYGGEEFAVILPRTGLADARIVAERCRQRVEQATVRQGTHQIRFTVSAGIAVACNGERSADVMARADAALYAAKTNGRNRVSLSHSPDAAPLRIATEAARTSA